MERSSRRFGHILLVLGIAMSLLTLGFVRRAEEYPFVLLGLPVSGIVLQAWVYYRTYRTKLLFATAIERNHAKLDCVHESLLAGLPVAN